MEFQERFIVRAIAPLCEEYDKIKGANTNIARIAPDLFDGLKPVARRTAYIMFLKDEGKVARKVAAITGETTSRLHHHGPSSVYSALVGLGQWWNNNIPLMETDSNFGSVAGDSAPADRYLKARLSAYCYDCFFADWKESAVDMIMGADEETMEPMYLPAKYPNILLNGSLGIGYGMASNIPPFNFKDIIEAAITLMKDPYAQVVLIPDSPTGADVVIGDFKKITDRGSGIYTMRCRYEIDSENNLITIVALPYQVTVNTIREKIAEIKEKGGLAGLVDMQDFSGKVCDLRLKIRDDVNPHKFMKKLINEIAGLEKNYPVNVTVIEDYKACDLSIRDILIEWIRYRREQKRVVVNHRRTTLLAEERTNDVKIFLMSKNNLQHTIELFKTSRNRAEIEKRLVEEYKNTSIRMDSLQARTLSEMRFYQLSIEAYEKCLARRDEIIKLLKEVEDILNDSNGIDTIIIGELRNGAKRFGTPRRSNVVPIDISIDTEVVGECILQLSGDGVILRRTATNIDSEPVPADINGFAVKVENDSAFVAVDEDGFFSFIRVREIPVDQEVPLTRYIKGSLGKIVALLPYDIDMNHCCTLISKKGIIKKIRVSDMTPSKKPCISISDGDKVIKGIVTRDIKTSKDILVYTNEGRGQRFDPNDIRLTSFTAKGGSGFKLGKDEEIIGCYPINPGNHYLLYVTIKGKARLNLTQYLPQRDSKHDEMVRLISLPDRDKLLAVIGCNKFDKLQVFFDDSTSEIIEIEKIGEGTMSSPPEKVTRKNAVSNNIVKVRLM